MPLFRKGSEHLDTKEQTQAMTDFFQQCTSIQQLNDYHDARMSEAIDETLRQIGEPPPCKFTLFVTGSGGRHEQGFWSDQDHGLIFECPEQHSYFKQFGILFSDNLARAGYVYCEGGIMTSHTMWNQSLSDWHDQIGKWLHSAQWADLRYAQIFYDARVIYGEQQALSILKDKMIVLTKDNPYLMHRFVENIMHLKTSLGPFGQLLPERYGEHQGQFDMKYTAFVPYVNCVRILALYYGVKETATLDRILMLQRQEPILKDAFIHFEQLLALRFLYSKKEKQEDSHFIQLKQLSATHRKHLKNSLKNVRKIHDHLIKRFS